MTNIRLSLDALLVLDAIERRGSFAAAAHELHRVPSAVTYTLQKLETDLDVPLFDRRGHRAKLTAAGRELLNEGRHLLRAAGELEARVRRVATGWEAELRIAYDGLLPASAMLALAQDFYTQHAQTRLRFTAEVLGGCWDSVVSGRADLAIGASGEGPSGGGYQTRPLGEIDWVFAVAPAHPLATAAEPLTRADILAHRAIVVADSSRNLPPRTTGLLSGQDTLTIADAAAKLQAQVMGLGVGYLPQCLAAAAADRGELVIRNTEEPKVSQILSLAWRTTHKGRALQWFVKQASAAGWLENALHKACA